MNLALTPQERRFTIIALLAATILAGSLGILAGRHDMAEAANRTATISRLKPPRHLDAEAMTRIRASLELAPGVDVEVGAIAQDAEALALAQELKTLFDGAGFKTRKLAQYALPQSVVSGVAVFSDHRLDTVLSEAIAQIFLELEQTLQWLEDDPVQLASAGEATPELRIIVGHR